MPSFECEKCKRQFSRKYNYIRHINKKKTCIPIIGSSVPNEKNEQDNIKKHECEYCNRRYKQKQHLTRHQKKCNGKPFKCEHCDKSYKRNSHLTRHLKTCSIKNQKEIELLKKELLKKEIKEELLKKEIKEELKDMFKKYHKPPTPVPNE
jgi:uncharacterized Zn-finger protein